MASNMEGLSEKKEKIKTKFMKNKERNGQYKHMMRNDINLNNISKYQSNMDKTISDNVNCPNFNSNSNSGSGSDSDSGSDSGSNDLTLGVELAPQSNVDHTKEYCEFNNDFQVSLDHRVDKLSSNTITNAKNYSSTFKKFKKSNKMENLISYGNTIITEDSNNLAKNYYNRKNVEKKYWKEAHSDKKDNISLKEKRQYNKNNIKKKREKNEQPKPIIKKEKVIPPSTKLLTVNTIPDITQSTEKKILSSDKNISYNELRNIVQNKKSYKDSLIAKTIYADHLKQYIKNDKEWDKVIYKISGQEDPVIPISTINGNDLLSKNKHDQLKSVYGKQDKNANKSDWTFDNLEQQKQCSFSMRVDLEQSNKLLIDSLSTLKNDPLDPLYNSSCEQISERVNCHETPGSTNSIGYYPNNGEELTKIYKNTIELKQDNGNIDLQKFEKKVDEKKNNDKNNNNNNNNNNNKQENCLEIKRIFEKEIKTKVNTNQQSIIPDQEQVSREKNEGNEMIYCGIIGKKLELELEKNKENSCKKMEKNNSTNNFYHNYSLQNENYIANYTSKKKESNESAELYDSLNMNLLTKIQSINNGITKHSNDEKLIDNNNKCNYNHDTVAKKALLENIILPFISVFELVVNLQAPTPNITPNPTFHLVKTPPVKDASTYLALNYKFDKNVEYLPTQLIKSWDQICDFTTCESQPNVTRTDADVDVDANVNANVNVDESECANHKYIQQNITFGEINKKKEEKKEYNAEKEENEKNESIITIITCIKEQFLRIYSKITHLYKTIYPQIEETVDKLRQHLHKMEYIIKKNTPLDKILALSTDNDNNGGNIYSFYFSKKNKDKGPGGFFSIPDEIQNDSYKKGIFRICRDYYCFLKIWEKENQDIFYNNDKKKKPRFLLDCTEPKKITKMLEIAEMIKELRTKSMTLDNMKELLISIEILEQVYQCRIKVILLLGQRLKKQLENTEYLEIKGKIFIENKRILNNNKLNSHIFKQQQPEQQQQQQQQQDRKEQDYGNERDNCGNNYFCKFCTKCGLSNLQKDQYYFCECLMTKLSLNNNNNNIKYNNKSIINPKIALDDLYSDLLIDKILPNKMLLHDNNILKTPRSSLSLSSSSSLILLALMEKNKNKNNNNNNNNNNTNNNNNNNAPLFEKFKFQKDKWASYFKINYEATYMVNTKDMDAILFIPKCLMSWNWFYDMERIVWDKKNNKKKFLIEWRDSTFLFIDFEEIANVNKKEMSTKIIQIFWDLLERNVNNWKISK